jgi:ubiquinone/menaquinone biosynthesis C-methylase UbiE
VRRLANTPELLDGPLDDLATLAGNLRDMGRVNARLGGTRLSRRAIEAVLGEARAAGAGGPVALLDVGTGGADIPVALLAGFARDGRPLRVTGVDRAEVIAAARAIRPDLDALPRLSLEVADGRTLPYDDRTFDVGHSSLVLHHLEPPDAVRFLTEMARVSRRGVVVNDLVRGRLAWIAARLLAPLVTRNRYSRYDGPLSVRRAYSVVEIQAMLAIAGLRPVATIRHPLRYRVAVAAVRA